MQKIYHYTIMVVLSQELVEEIYDVLSDLKLMKEANCLGLILSFASRENYYNSLSLQYLFDSYNY